MKRFYIVVAALLVASPAFAQSTMQQKLEARFAAADVDHDGKLTRAEAQTGMPRVAQHFDEIDSAHVGYVTLPQIEQFAAQRMR